MLSVLGTAVYSPFVTIHTPQTTRFTNQQRLLKEFDEVTLSALGTAVSTMVSVAEILKKEGFVVEKSEFGGVPVDFDGCCMGCMNCVAWTLSPYVRSHRDPDLRSHCTCLSPQAWRLTWRACRSARSRAAARRAPPSSPR